MQWMGSQTRGTGFQAQHGVLGSGMCTSVCLSVLGCAVLKQQPTVTVSKTPLDVATHFLAHFNPHQSHVSGPLTLPFSFTLLLSPEAMVQLHLNLTQLQPQVNLDWTVLCPAHWTQGPLAVNWLHHNLTTVPPKTPTITMTQEAP